MHGDLCAVDTEGTVVGLFGDTPAAATSDVRFDDDDDDALHL